MIIFNEVADDIVEEKHICFYTRIDGEKIFLMEVYEKILKHPQAKDVAIVSKIDTRTIKDFYRTQLAAAPIVLLEAAQNNMK